MLESQLVGGAADTYSRIYQVVSRIPPGTVATYGQVAKLAGMGGHPRLVGYALHSSDDPSLPWHRVINARGEISRRSWESGWEQLQRRLLESEGVRFDRRGRVPLRRYRWRRGV